VYLDVPSIPIAVDHDKVLLIVKRGQHAVPDVPVIVDPLSRLGDEGMGCRRAVWSVFTNDHKKRLRAQWYERLASKRVPLDLGHHDRESNGKRPEKTDNDMSFGPDGFRPCQCVVPLAAPAIDEEAIGRFEVDDVAELREVRTRDLRCDDRIRHLETASRSRIARGSIRMRPDEPLRAWSATVRSVS
jgi:hypothetical protein